MKNKERDQIFWRLMLFSGVILFFSSQASTGRWFQIFERPALRIERNLSFLKQRLVDAGRLVSFCGPCRENVRKLEEALAQSAVSQGELAVYQEENEAMRRLLAAPLPPAWHFIPAKLVSFWQEAKLNVGRKAGVEAGQMVVSENILVGKIKQVQDYSSTITLMTDSNVKIPVIIRSPDQSGIKARGVLSGYQQDRLILSEVLVNEEFAKGALVFTSGDGDYLADLLVGKIAKIDASKEKVFKQAWVEPLIKFDHLRYLFVIKVIQPEL